VKLCTHYAHIIIPHCSHLSISEMLMSHCSLKVVKLQSAYSREELRHLRMLTPNTEVFLQRLHA